jgi:hypothetical protein
MPSCNTSLSHYAATLFVALLFPVLLVAQEQLVSPNRLAAARLIDRAYQMHTEDVAGQDTVLRAGVLIAEGDSWFDYPRWDVLKVLKRRYGYDIATVAHYGQTLEEMTFDPRQLAELIDRFEGVRRAGKTPRAILLSAGGNDLAGPELGVILNYREPGIEPVDQELANRIIDVRLRRAMSIWLLAVTGLPERVFARKIPILVHGYDYPVPDGRGFLGGLLFLPGPWLEPSFTARGYREAPEGLTANAAVMRDVIDRFNRMLQSLPNEPALSHVRFVSLRGTLSNSPSSYRTDWDNELHPTGRGFTAVVARFQEALLALP